MTLIQELMNQASVGGLLNTQTIQRFSPAEIRETIQSLVATEQLALANALGDAGISLYPESEDILAMCALLAESRQDWTAAEEMLAQLILKQNGNTPVATWQHYIRVLRCLCELQSAMQITEHALEFHPENPVLMAELQSLMNLLGDSHAMQPTETRH